jgi:ABC-type multidrug transport system fused ATPase/permease subunit
VSQGRLHSLAGFLRPYRRHLFGLLALTGILSLLAMLPPLMVRAVINEVIVEGHDDRFPRLAFFLLIVPVVSAASGYLQVLGMAFVGQRFIMDLRMSVYRHFLSLSMRFFSKHSVGKLVNRLMGDSGVVQTLLTVSTVQVVSDLVCAAFAIGITFRLNWRLALLLIGVLCLFVLNYSLNAARMRRLTRGYRFAEDRVAGGVQNRLAANLIVKTFGAEMREQRTFEGESRTSMGLMREAENAAVAFYTNTNALSDLGRAVIYFIGCALVLRGEAGYGDVVAFTSYAVQLLAPAVRFSTLARQIQDSRISAERLFELMDEKPEVPARPGGVKPARTEGRVDFDHVSFGYDPERTILHDFDLRVPPGHTIALVGPTGCGKTTVLSLLMRFYDVNAGAIRIDGVDIREMDPGVVRKRFGIVLQESLLFNVSVADNIRYSRPQATAAEIEAAARVAEIHDTIVELPNGYETPLGGRHAQLSVGQKQRISIARAVLANPAIIIMDEATSSLDSESEMAIQTAMKRFLKGRTSFIVAHRLSTIRHADCIVLLEQGQIREMGKHRELVRIPGGAYRNLFEKYASRGVIDNE